MAVSKTVDTAESITEAVNSTPLGQFSLTADQVAALSAKRGRAPVDSIFLSNMKWAKDHKGEFAGVKINGEPKDLDAEDKPTYTGPKWSPNFVQGQLRKAAKQLNLSIKEYTVYDRSTLVSTDFPDGFIAFVVNEPKAAEVIPAPEGDPIIPAVGE